MTSADIIGVVDISEDEIKNWIPDLLNVLLRDHSAKHDAKIGSSNPDEHHIIWATDSYETLGNCYNKRAQIRAELITGKNGRVIRPRAVKTKVEQQTRTRNKAEVFTPSWVCNAQNNLIDNEWFGRIGVFNTENNDKTWTTNPEKITFPEGKTWIDYVKDCRLEITCGEAPYLVSRYDTVTGEYIPVEKRIGLLDRKLRVVNENTSTPDEWVPYAHLALASVYGYEWQGDSLLLAREAALCTFMDHFWQKFPNENLFDKTIIKSAYIISWNLWQMDGLKGKIPYSEKVVINTDLYGSEEKTIEEGVYCEILSWKLEPNKKGILNLRKDKKSQFFSTSLCLSKKYKK
ncbi:MAG: restriction endonuclease subunit M [Salinivirgaceae bacterium]|nr:restriction endonuclease subunit M [Salinivirgaceae bacterium]